MHYNVCFVNEPFGTDCAQSFRSVVATVQKYSFKFYSSTFKQFGTRHEHNNNIHADEHPDFRDTLLSGMGQTWYITYQAHPSFVATEYSYKCNVQICLVSGLGHVGRNKEHHASVRLLIAHEPLSDSSYPVEHCYPMPGQTQFLLKLSAQRLAYFYPAYLAFFLSGEKGVTFTRAVRVRSIFPGWP